MGSDQLGEQRKPEPIRLITGGRGGTAIGSETQNNASEKRGKPK
jgi:hypothetical protein